MTVQYKHHCQGFTLLELMVALFIFAIAALVLLKNTHQLIQQQYRLEDKTLALWLAENRLAEMRLMEPWPIISTTVHEISVAHRQWEVSADVSETAVPTLRKVIVRVKRGNHHSANTDASIFSLTGYVGEH